MSYAGRKEELFRKRRGVHRRIIVSKNKVSNEAMCLTITRILGHWAIVFPLLWVPSVFSQPPCSWFVGWAKSLSCTSHHHPESLKTNTLRARFPSWGGGRELAFHSSGSEIPQPLSGKGRCLQLQSGLRAGVFLWDVFDKTRILRLRQKTITCCFS